MTMPTIDLADVRGLRAEVYRDATYRSKANVLNGYDRVTVVGANPSGGFVSPVFAPGEEAPAVILGQTTPGHIVAWPVGKEGRHTMFGGSFIYTSDSRFPTGRPIPLHDRYEGDFADWPGYDTATDYNQPPHSLRRGRRAVIGAYPGNTMDLSAIQDTISDLLHLADTLTEVPGLLFTDTWSLVHDAYARHAEERALHNH